ncbi:hypothetical protein OG782_17200 [Streptomyces sp. NBC_00876]|uniref:hypothetical protein n=1 Tax=Streptomyces sp. NBC_00876 TaxID=2975853 RepID=UPI0038695C05|nr:hypothetical protein OG782_17200 [Streptomyces sp. NBC_00876]
MSEDGSTPLLLVADSSASDALGPFTALRGWLTAQGVDLQVRSYRQVAGGLPPMPGNTVVILCFPHTFWDSEVEGRLPGPYGTRAYARALHTYLLRTGRKLAATAGGSVRYLNPPGAVALTRDKAAAQGRLLRYGVPVPEILERPDPAELLAELERGNSLYVKAVCGSMGKGLTHLAPDRWRTNYHYDGRSLLAPGGPVGRADWERREQWLFREVPVGERRFLELLCGTPGFLFERQIGAPRDGAHRTELRITVAGGTAVAADERTAPRDALTTRRAEGGSGRPAAPGDPVVRAASRAAVRAAAALGLGYGVFDVVSGADGEPYVVDTTAFPATGTPAGLWKDLLDLLVVRPAVGARPAV